MLDGVMHGGYNNNGCRAFEGSTTLTEALSVFPPSVRGVSRGPLSPLWLPARFSHAG